MLREPESTFGHVAHGLFSFLTRGLKSPEGLIWASAGTWRGRSPMVCRPRYRSWKAIRMARSRSLWPCTSPGDKPASGGVPFRFTISLAGAR
jgi:hypothetical protein